MSQKQFVEIGRFSTKKMLVFLIKNLPRAGVEHNVRKNVGHVFDPACPTYASNRTYDLALDSSMDTYVQPGG